MPATRRPSPSRLPTTSNQLAIDHNQLGAIYGDSGDNANALRHFQQSIKYKEASGNTYGAALTRYNVAALLTRAGRYQDALHYANAALNNFEQAGPGAADRADIARQLIADLEQRTR